jgi:hypothetical protein
MAERDESATEPDREIHIYDDGTTVEAIHAERGLRGYGSTDREALQHLVDAITNVDCEEPRYGWQK